MKINCIYSIFSNSENLAKPMQTSGDIDNDDREGKAGHVVLLLDCAHGPRSCISQQVVPSNARSIGVVTCADDATACGLDKGSINRLTSAYLQWQRIMSAPPPGVPGPG
jgi:hypothetical protein